MTLFGTNRKLRALFSLMAVLVLFLALSAGVLAMRQKELLHDLERVHAVKELELMGTLAREALLKRDYATVVQFLHSWGLDNPDIAAIEAVATNGYRLALYEKEHSTNNTFTASTDVMHGDRKLMSIKMVKDLAGVDRRLNGLFLQGTAAFLIFAVVMGSVLWVTLRRTAIIPMEEHVREIEKLNRGLESRVEKRTADLVAANSALKFQMKERLKAEEKLRRNKAELVRQNEKLKRLDTVKDSLVRDISHELKTPVANHLMQLEMLGGILDGQEAIDSVREILEVMEFGIRRQQAIIGNILVMSRLEEGGRRPVILPLRIDTLIEDVLNEYRHVISAYGINLQLELIPATIETDRELLRHVFSNLVDNAVKYRDHKEPWLQIRMEAGEDVITVLVRDNGVGFSDIELKKAFERFYQSSASTDGVGLGLSIVRKILQKLGGAVDIESEGKQKGSAFLVSLPVQAAGDIKRTTQLEGEQG